MSGLLRIYPNEEMVSLSHFLYSTHFETPFKHEKNLTNKHVIKFRKLLVTNSNEVFQ